jgi:hypothetical protein
MRASKRKPSAGDVFEFHSQVAGKLKIHLVVAISINQDIAYCAIINSRINPHFPNAKLLIGKNGRNYLDHDSFVDCEKVYPKFVREFLNHGGGMRYRGTMPAEDFEKVKRLMWEDGDISLAEFEDMGFSADDFD